MMNTFEHAGENHQLGGYIPSELTLDGFFQALTATRDAFEWYLSRQGCLLARLKDSRNQEIFNPITAVAHTETGQFYPDGQWSDAAADIGLAQELRAEVFVAASYDWVPISRQGALRSAMLRAVSIQTDGAYRKVQTENNPVPLVHGRRHSARVH